MILHIIGILIFVTLNLPRIRIVFMYKTVEREGAIQWNGFMMLISPQWHSA